MNSTNAFLRTVRNFLTLGVLLLCAGSIALAQAGRGSISGLVTDPGGALVPGAQVVLLNSATGVEQHSLTTSAGLYTFISLSPGVYQVTVSQTSAGNKYLSQTMKRQFVNLAGSCRLARFQHVFVDCS